MPNLQKKVKVVYKNYPGYVKGMFFDIMNCERCNTQFSNPNKIDKKMYEIIYSNKKTPPYKRYFEYSKNIKNVPNPLRFLAEKEYLFSSLLSCKR